MASIADGLTLDPERQREFIAARQIIADLLLKKELAELKIRQMELEELDKNGLNPLDGFIVYVDGSEAKIINQRELKKS